MSDYPSRGGARIGVLVPFTNTNLEPDMILLRPGGASLHFARMGGYDAEEIPDEDQMAGLGAADLDGPLSLLLGVKPDVVLYGCTSATLAHGPAFDRELAAKIKAQGGTQCVTAAGALVNALRTLNARKIAFASPYVARLNDIAIAFLADEGVKTVTRADFPEQLGNDGQGALTPEQVADLARQADSAEAEAIVLSCTDMRAVECIAALEAELAKPVITSNQAMMFQTLQLLSLPDTPAGYGRLFERLTP